MVDLTFGKSAVDAIESLKAAFGVTTNAEVVSKALSLAQILAREADGDHNVLIAAKDGTPIELKLAG
jgi:uncharacterized protein with von Willebrand factor type A (vWA) domain